LKKEGGTEVSEKEKNLGRGRQWRIKKENENMSLNPPPPHVSEISKGAIMSISPKTEKARVSDLGIKWHYLDNIAT